MLELVDFCNLYCPEKTGIWNKKLQSWVTLNLEKKQFRKRDKVHLLLINHPTEEKKFNYETQCKLVNRLMRNTKRNYYDRKINWQSNAKSLFNAFKEFSGEASSVGSTIDVNNFNNFLCESVEGLQSIYLVILLLQT